MQLNQPSAEIWTPDGANEKDALARVTHMAIAAHQDDVEIMALDGILAAFARCGFMAVIVTNGAGSPRAGQYANYNDQQMREVRRLEQKKAGFVGQYSAVGFLEYPSAAVKDGNDRRARNDLKNILAACHAEIVYTHNLADKHDTHVAVALQTIAAIRELPIERRPKKLYAGEVWRNLDWLVESDKVIFDLGECENIARSLVGVFDSQIAGGKRYDLAVMGRRRANATFFESHAVDAAEWVDFGMDLTPLIESPELDPAQYIGGFIRRFSDDVRARIERFRLSR